MLPGFKNTEIKINNSALIELKDFLNDNLKYTVFSDGSGKILRIDSLHEIILDDKLAHYGIMGKFKDHTHTFNSSGNLYGKGFERWEYPGSINVHIIGINLFLRKIKIRKINKNMNHQ